MNYNVYSMNLDGSNRVQLVDDKFLEVLLATEDSDIVIYAGADDFMPYIDHHAYAIRNDGTGLVDLKPNAESVMTAQSVGGKIYYAQRPCPGGQTCTSYLHSVNPDGSGDVRLLDSPDDTFIGGFQVASNGSFAIYGNSFYAPTSLTTVEFPSQATSTFYEDPQTQSREYLNSLFKLSPDDKYVLIGRSCSTFHYTWCSELVTFEVSSGAMNTITENEALGVALWSPNGKYIVYSEMGEDYSTRVYIYDTESKQNSQIKESDTGRYFILDWSDNGQYILASKFYSSTQADLVMFSYDGSGEVNLTNYADGFGATDAQFSK